MFSTPSSHIHLGSDVIFTFVHITQKPKDMIDNERICMMALAMTEGINNAKAHILLDHFGTATEVFAARSHPWEIARGLGSGYPASRIVSRMEEGLRRAEQEARFIEQHRIRLYTITDPDYPRRLAEYDNPPIVCYYRGSADLNAPKVIGVVGTRRATPYGLRLAEKLLRDVAKVYPEMLVISGLAYGIDVCAHRTALQLGLPTVGVFAHGLDNCYPKSHCEIARRMIERGGLFTDYPSETPIAGENFLKRNRLIAGLSDAIVVVESFERGGALSTATHAFANSRDVFAFPGNVGDDHSLGCNQLIRDNKAGLILSANDLFRGMLWDVHTAESHPHIQMRIPFEA